MCEHRHSKIIVTVISLKVLIADFSTRRPVSQHIG